MKIHSNTYGNFDVLIDLDDVDMVQKYKWGIMVAKSKVCDYVKFYVSGGGNKVLLHRYLTDCPKGMVVDHIDGNTLNNTRDNIRVCTFSQNRKNNPMYKKQSIWAYRGYVVSIQRV